MAAILTDAEIQDVLADRKPITLAAVAKLRKPPLLKNHSQRSARVYITGSSGRKYVLGVRLSTARAMSFTVRLALVRNGKEINLIRCNGHHGPHKNTLEMTTIPANTFHIHVITERYQAFPGKDPEYFAQPTVAYNSFAGAVDYCSFKFGIHVIDDKYKGGLFAALE